MFAMFAMFAMVAAHTVMVRSAGGRGCRRGCAGAAHVRVLREGETAKAQHEGQSQNDSKFVSHN